MMDILMCYEHRTDQVIEVMAKHRVEGRLVKGILVGARLVEGRSVGGRLLEGRFDLRRIT